MDRLVIIGLLMSSILGASESFQSGSFLYNFQNRGDLILSSQPSRTGRDSIELIQNGDFETGSLPPWESQGTYWFVTTELPQSGTYCASDTGNHWIRQNITPTLSDSIISITFWSRQPEEAIQAFDFIWEDSTYFEDIIYITANWQKYDVTSYLPSGKRMVAFRLWGYSGGGPDPDVTFIDSISIQAETTPKIEEGISDIAGRAFQVRPNPAYGKVTVDILLPTGDVKTLSIYDAQGSLVKKVNLKTDRFIWDTKGLCPGVYFIRLDIENKEHSFQKLVLIK